MKNGRLFCLLASAGLVAALGGCATEEVGTSEEIDGATLRQIEALGFDSQSAARFQEQDPIVGSRSGFLLEGDLKIAEDQLLNLEVQDIEGEQYRALNLVAGLPRTLVVLGYTGGSYALDPSMQTALKMAVDNYNALGISISFKLTFGTNTSIADIVVYKTGSGAGGASGYPSGGDPYPYVQVFPSTSLYGLDVLEHVFTHHIGHCVGMAHPDYTSGPCYNPTGGAVYIPGTPTSDPNSIWNACFTTTTNGEFSNYDVVALNYLY